MKKVLCMILALVMTVSSTAFAGSTALPNVLEQPGDHRPVPTVFEKSKSYDDLHFFPMAADADVTFNSLTGGKVILGNEALFDYYDRYCLEMKITDFENIIKEGDVCLMSFKVKVNSGEGYVKPWVQDIKSRKALFAQTIVGSAGGDFTECYLPFVGIPDIRDIGIRFGGKIQNITLKDFKIENFGTTKKLSELPSTITGKNDTSPSFADLIANAQ